MPGVYCDINCWRCVSHTQTCLSTQFNARKLPDILYPLFSMPHKCYNITAMWYPFLEMSFPHLHLPIHSIPWQNHARNPISTDFYPRKTLPSVRNQYQGLSEMDNITAMWYPFVEMNFPHSHLSIHSIPWQNHARNPISTDYVPDNTTQWQKSIPRVFSIWITSLQCDIPF